jgi:hypothetical protein
MSEPGRASTAGAAANAAVVTVEAVSWMTRFVGGDGTSRILLTETMQPGDTPLTVLRRISRRFPELDQMLWDSSSRAMAEHVQVMLNNVLVGPNEVSQHVLAPGDTITLLGQYMGG